MRWLRENGPLIGAAALGLSIVVAFGLIVVGRSPERPVEYRTVDVHGVTCIEATRGLRAVAISCDWIEFGDPPR